MLIPHQQQEIAADTLKENDLDPEKDEKQLQELIKVIKDTVNAEKKRIREEKAAWKAKIDGIGAEKKKALDELKIWKYYPQNEYPDVSGNKVRTSFLFALRLSPLGWWCVQTLNFIVSVGGVRQPLLRKGGQGPVRTSNGFVLSPAPGRARARSAPLHLLEKEGERRSECLSP